MTQMILIEHRMRMIMLRVSRNDVAIPVKLQSRRTFLMGILRTVSVGLLPAFK